MDPEELLAFVTPSRRRSPKFSMESWDVNINFGVEFGGGAAGGGGGMGGSSL